MLPNIDKSIRISIYQSVSSSGMLYCNLGTRCVMCSVVDNGVFEAHRGAPPICVSGWMPCWQEACMVARCRYEFFLFLTFFLIIF